MVIVEEEDKAKVNNTRRGSRNQTGAPYIGQAGTAGPHATVFPGAQNPNGLIDSTLSDPDDDFDDRYISLSKHNYYHPSFYSRCA